MNVRAVLLDIGEVLIKLDFSPLIRLLGVPAELTLLEALKKAEGIEVFDRFERGTLSSLEFLAYLNQKRGSSLDWETFEPQWNGIVREEVEGIATLLTRLAKQVPLYALTNSNAVHFDHILKQFSWMSLFKEVFSSHLLGSRKPEPAIYRAVIKRMRAKPGKILFIDDRLENVLGAREAGLISEHCPASPASLTRILTSYGFRVSLDGVRTP